VMGIGLPQPIALAVLSESGKAADKSTVEAELDSLKNEVNATLDAHERIHKIVIVNEEWSVENNILTPTLKIKRNVLETKYSPSFENWYKESSPVVRESL